MLAGQPLQGSKKISPTTIIASYVVAGALHFDMLQECSQAASNACSAYKYIDQRCSGKDETILHPLGFTQARWTGQNVLVAKGQSYYFDMDTLHRLVVPVGDQCGSLSVVLRNPRARDYTTLLIAKERSTNVMSSKPCLSHVELRALCNSITTTFLWPSLSDCSSWTMVSGGK